MIYAGIDAGGTRTRVLVEDQTGQRISEHPAVNVQQTGMQIGAERLALALRKAVDNSSPDALVCVAMGIAGAGRPDDRIRLHERLLEALNDWREMTLALFSDADLALHAAFAGDGGMIVIAGTGSIALARGPDGLPLRAGGWGSLLGDEGSGHDLGLQGLRAVARAFDGGPATLLTDFAPAAGQLVDSIYQNHLRPAEFAPHVIKAAEQGDAVAGNLLADAVRALSGTAALLAARTSDVPKRLALFGGLCTSDTYRNALRRALNETLPDWILVEPAMTAVEAALQLAKRHPTNRASS